MKYFLYIAFPNFHSNNMKLFWIPNQEAMNNITNIVIFTGMKILHDELEKNNSLYYI